MDFLSKRQDILRTLLPLKSTTNDPNFITRLQRGFIHESRRLRYNRKQLNFFSATDLVGRALIWSLYLVTTIFTVYTKMASEKNSSKIRHLEWRDRATWQKLIYLSLNALFLNRCHYPSTSIFYVYAYVSFSFSFHVLIFCFFVSSFFLHRHLYPCCFPLNRSRLLSILQVTPSAALSCKS